MTDKKPPAGPRDGDTPDNSEAEAREEHRCG